MYPNLTRILSGIPFLGRALHIVLYHHERWDGQGYPHGLRAEEIPKWARLFAVVDTVDAMTSDRPYRAALPLERALEELRAQSGRQFDPHCVAAFERIDPDAVGCVLPRIHSAIVVTSVSAAITIPVGRRPTLSRMIAKRMGENP